jgi:hypothetical protein
MRIVLERPDYHLFENNCQNFVKFLLEVICPGSPIPATIENVLARWQDISTSRQGLSLPGAYPPSITTTERLSFVTASETSWVTASETSWVTASGDTWVTAVDCLSFRDSNSHFREGSLIAQYLTEFRGPKFQFDDDSIASPLMNTILEEPIQIAVRAPPVLISPPSALVRNSQVLREYKSVQTRKLLTPLFGIGKKSKSLCEYKIIVVGGQGILSPVLLLK